MKVVHFHFTLNVGQEHESGTCTRGGLGRRQLRKWGKHALSVACLFRCHLSCRFGKSRRPASPCSRKHASERLRAFCDIVRTTTVKKGPRCKVILLIIQQVVGKARLRIWELRIRLLIQNSVSLSQFMLSKIPTLSWVQSHVGVIMGRKVQQRWLEATLHQLFRRVQEIEGRGGENKPCFCICVPPASGDNTQNRCTLRFNSLSKRLLFVPLCFFSFFLCPCCFYTLLLTHQPLPLEASPTARKQQRSPSRHCLMTYITFSLRGGTAGLHVVCA